MSEPAILVPLGPEPSALARRAASDPRQGRTPFQRRKTRGPGGLCTINREGQALLASTRGRTRSSGCAGFERRKRPLRLSRGEPFKVHPALKETGHSNAQDRPDRENVMPISTMNGRWRWKQRSRVRGSTHLSSHNPCPGFTSTSSSAFCGSRHIWCRTFWRLMSLRWRRVRTIAPIIATSRIRPESWNKSRYLS